jgi:hypothetical protein
MPFCTNCGTGFNETQRFCGSCGAPVGPLTATSISPPPVESYKPQPDTHTVLATLPQVTKPKFGLADNYTMVFTADAVIFAKLTNEVLKDVIRKSQAESKAAGKGWMGKVGDQMKAFYNAHQRYHDMSPEAILAEDKANFSLPHDSVHRLNLKSKYSGGDGDGPGDEHLELEFECSSGKYKFQSASASKEVLELLGSFYGPKIRR